MTPELHMRAKEIFTAALPLPVAARNAMLVALADAEPEVAREVASLLQHHTTQTLIATPSATTVGPTSAATITSARANHRPLGRPLVTLRRFTDRLGPSGTLWLGVLLACIVLGVASYITELVKQTTTRDLRSSALTGALNATVRALELWIEQEKGRVEVVSVHPEIPQVVARIIEQAQRDAPSDELRQSHEQTQLRTQMTELFGATVRYAVWDRRHVTIADWSEDGTGIGGGVSPYGGSLLTKVFAGETVIQLPGIRPPITKDYPLATSGHRVGVIVPLRNAQRQVVAAMLIYGLGAEERFRDILSIVRIGNTGETFAFDEAATMISTSRFHRELRDVQLLRASASVDEDQATMIALRDPGRRLTKAQPASPETKTWPLTKMARYATAGEDGMDLHGYRSYRGTMVVGAWKWMEPYQMGVATEIGLDEIRTKLQPLSFDTTALLGLLGTSFVAILLSWQTLQRLRKQLEKLELVGPYTLEAKIGEGGMGVVYRARHTFLKRQTAIKFLKPSAVHARATTWFEREARLASQLTHPHTITIFDYGVTREGVCYYVMEYLEGLNLEQLVQRDGPLSSQHVTRLLLQICGALREAHELGLIHRDIKPHNIMVCHIGGEDGFVKVLDFGLVTSVQPIDTSSPSTAPPRQPSTILAGTPIYMAPERFVESVASDARVDIYAVGAVAFFLLTGREIFVPSNDKSLLEQIVHETPPHVSSLIREPIPTSLDGQIAKCLAKSPALRPQTIQEVIEALTG